ncbi:MAG: hypothetical protein VB089_00550 [Anaerolineaceae bacterium]|nr:hypothetical protein [Anaerolineaceae bacterium]
MNESKRSNLAIGAILILFGLILLGVRLVPGLEDLLAIRFTWPLIIIAVGAGLLLFGALVGAPEMAIPACIVAGTGGILYWQNLTGAWGSWAYIWTLYPGFTGVGILLARLLGSQRVSAMREGTDLILTSAVMFLIFGSFLGGFRMLGSYWPVVLILAGLLIVVRNFLPRRTAG